MPRQGRRDELHEEVGVGDPGAGLLARPLAPGDQAADVDLAEEIEVGRGGPARGHALDHDAPDGADAGRLRPRRARRLAELRRERYRPRGRRRPGPEPRSARMSRPRSAASRRAFGDAAAEARAAVPSTAGFVVLPARDVGEHVGLLDPAAGRRHLREVDAVLLGDLPGEGRRLDRRRRRGDRSGAAGRGRRDRGAADRRASSGAKMSAIVWPTGTTSPSARSRRQARPEAGASISVVTLSVSISTSGSPFVTVSPGDLSQCRTLPRLLRQLERRHDDVRGHQAFRQSAFAASKTVFSVGTVRSSRTGENGTGTSMAPDALDRRVEVIEGAVRDHRRRSRR